LLTVLHFNITGYGWQATVEIKRSQPSRLCENLAICAAIQENAPY